MKETKSSTHKTLKNVWRKVKHGQRKGEKDEYIILLCRNDALIEKDIDDYSVKRTAEKSDISDSRWDEIEFISSAEQNERTDVPKKKKKFRKRVWQFFNILISSYKVQLV